MTALIDDDLSAQLGMAKRDVSSVVAEALDALSHDEHEINTASNERLELWKLHASDPLAVDR